MKTPICVYVDNSNIFHEGQRFSQEQRSEDRRSFRIHFGRFIELISENQSTTEIVWGGSTPPSTDDVWANLSRKGITPHLIPRSTTGENETVDHLVQLQMHRHARKYRDSPGTMVVCTGDGKGYDDEEGFLFDVEGFVKDGWLVKVVSWTHSCSARLKAFAQQHGEFVALENHYDDVTFIEGGRRIKSAPGAARRLPPKESDFSSKLKEALQK